MTSKKYQIFISSTLHDLVEERQLALKAVLDLDHIPASGAVYPFADELAPYLARWNELYQF